MSLCTEQEQKLINLVRVCLSAYHSDLIVRSGHGFLCISPLSFQGHHQVHTHSERGHLESLFSSYLDTTTKMNSPKSGIDLDVPCTHMHVPVYNYFQLGHQE